MNFAERVIGELKASGETGDREAQVALGAVFETTGENPTEAMYWYSEAIKHGSSFAKIRLSLLLWRRGRNEDWTRIEELLSAAINENAYSANFFLGQLLLSGARGTARCEEGEKLIIDAARKGFVNAAMFLADHYSLGSDADGAKLKTAFDWYLLAAEKGNPRAAFHVGTAYLLGKGVEKDETLARSWLVRAQGLGSMEAQNALQLLPK